LQFIGIFVIKQKIVPMNTEILDALRKCMLFNGISGEEMMDMMHSVHYRVVNFHRGDILAYAGTTCLHADIVVGGEVVTSMMGPSGRIIRITKHPVGSMLAPAFLYANDNNYPVTVEATKETQVFRMTPHDLNTLMEKDSRLAMNYIRMVSNIVSFLTKKVGMLSMNVREKMTLFLREERSRQHSNRILINMTRQELADHFGIQKYSLQRCLKEMQEEGEIKLDGKFIIFTI